MHNRIFQIKESPVELNDYITESTFLGTGFIDGVADYVSGVTDRSDDIDWLVGFLENAGLDITRDGDKISFSYAGLIEVMNTKLDKTQESLDKLKLSLSSNGNEKTSTPTDDFDFLRFRLLRSLNNKHGMYVFTDDGYCTLDDWLSSLFMKFKKKETYTFYVGATLDYHF